MPSVGDGVHPEFGLAHAHLCVVNGAVLAAPACDFHETEHAAVPVDHALDVCVKEVGDEVAALRCAHGGTPLRRCVPRTTRTRVCPPEIRRAHLDRAIPGHVVTRKSSMVSRMMRF